MMLSRFEAEREGSCGVVYSYTARSKAAWVLNKASRPLFVTVHRVSRRALVDPTTSWRPPAHSKLVVHSVVQYNAAKPVHYPGTGFRFEQPI